MANHFDIIIFADKSYQAKELEFFFDSQSIHGEVVGEASALKALAEVTFPQILIGVTNQLQTIEQLHQIQAEIPVLEDKPLIWLGETLSEADLDQAWSLANFYDFWSFSELPRLLRKRAKNACQYVITSQELDEFKATDEVTGLLRLPYFEAELHKFWQQDKRDESYFGFVLLKIQPKEGGRLSEDQLKIIGQAILQHIHRPSDMATYYDPMESLFLITLKSTDLQGTEVVSKKIINTLVQEASLSVVSEYDSEIPDINQSPEQVINRLEARIRKTTSGEDDYDEF